MCEQDGVGQESFEALRLVARLALCTSFEDMMDLIRTYVVEARLKAHITKLVLLSVPLQGVSSKGRISKCPSHSAQENKTYSASARVPHHSLLLPIQFSYNINQPQNKL